MLEISEFGYVMSPFGPMGGDAYPSGVGPTFAPTYEKIQQLTAQAQAAAKAEEARKAQMALTGRTTNSKLATPTTSTRPSTPEPTPTVVETGGGVPMWLWVAGAGVVGIALLTRAKGKGGLHGLGMRRRSRSIRTFIKDNRSEIDSAIKRTCPNCQRFNDEERRQWVLNDEGLYNWARQEGVKI